MHFAYFSLASSLHAAHCPNYNELQFVGDHWELTQERADEGWAFHYNPYVNQPFIGFGARVDESGALCIYKLRRTPLEPSQEIDLRNTRVIDLEQLDKSLWTSHSPWPDTYFCAVDPTVCTFEWKD